jgi:hypothetical protein
MRACGGGVAGAVGVVGVGVVVIARFAAGALPC